MHKVQGKIVDIMEAIQISEKFVKREFVIEDASGMYPQTLIFQTVQDKTAILDGFAIGQTVEVSFNLRGRAWTSPQNEIKYFNTLEAWRVESIGGQSTDNGPRTADDLNHKTEEANDDDLPF